MPETPSPEPAPAAEAPPRPPGTPPPLPSLPYTWRPRRARIAGFGIALFVLVVVGGVAMLLPSAGGTSLRTGDRIGVFGVGVGLAWFLSRHASVRVTARADGLDIRNLFRRRRVGWHEVAAVTLRRGDPWVTLDLADGSALSVMGIQSSDGPAAPAAARELARLVAREAARNPPPQAPPAAPDPNAG